MDQKILTILNLALLLTAGLLLLNLLGFQLPTFGQAAFWLDRHPPVCLVHSKGQNNSLNDPDLCCYYLQAQLKCETSQQFIPVENQKIEVNKNCYINKEKVNYLVNEKQYNYCKKGGYLN